MQPDSKSGFALIRCDGATHGFACTPGNSGIDFHRTLMPATGKASTFNQSFFKCLSVSHSIRKWIRFCPQEWKRTVNNLTWKDYEPS